MLKEWTKFTSCKRKKPTLIDNSHSWTCAQICQHFFFQCAFPVFFPPRVQNSAPNTTACRPLFLPFRSILLNASETSSHLTARGSIYSRFPPPDCAMSLHVMEDFGNGNMGGLDKVLLVEASACVDNPTRRRTGVYRLIICGPWYVRIRIWDRFNGNQKDLTGG